MTPDELKQARGFLLAFEGNAKVYGNMETAWIHHGPFRLVWDEIQRATNAFPGLIPPCREADFLLRQTPNGNLYSPNAIESFLAIAIGKLRAAVEESESVPFIERREFRFVNDPNLRSLLERDYEEIQRAFIAKCWKSVIILSGGGIEALLTDVLAQNALAARAAKSAPKEANITKWDLADLIAVAVELKKVSKGAERLSSPVRTYRNLVHPGNELRSGLTFGPEEARIALEVLHILHRDLSK